MTRRRSLALTVTLGLSVGSCGGDEGDDASRPLIADIDPAIDAVERELGGAQRYFEINATPQLVNLFVADVDAGTVTPYVYAGDRLQDPGEAVAVSGGTPFTAADVSEDLGAIIGGVTDELPDSDVSVFVIFPDEAGRPRYGATVTSASGGVLEVDLGADGQVLAVDAEA
ncbi:MAG: hypothetical protein ACK5OX_09825 [Desertimonas sp.]